MKIILNNNLGSVEDVEVFGSDETIYQAARVCTGYGFKSRPKDEETLNRFLVNLLKREHMRCFEFGAIVFGIRCPIFVERQLRTYRKPELERSLRYCEPIELEEETEGLTEFHYACLQEYKERRKNGEPREEARRVLPLDTLTEVVSIYSIRSLLHVFDERLAPPAQSETSKIVEAMERIATRYFPQTINAYHSMRSE